MYAVVVGDGKIAESVTRELIGAGLYVGIVAPHRPEVLAEHFPGALVIRGEAGDIESLAAAGAHDADMLFALCEKDALNLATCVEARQVFGIENVISISSCDDNEAAFRALRTEVICTPRTVAHEVSLRAGLDTLVHL